MDNEMQLEPLVDPKNNRYFDFDPNDLSYRQKMQAAVWAEVAMPWVLENIGEYKKEWWVVLDKDHNSLRVQFATQEQEMYFSMSMCNNEASVAT